MSIIKKGELGEVYFEDSATGLTSEKFYDAKDFINGYGAVQYKKNGLWFYIDEDLYVCGMGYDTVYTFKDGFARVKIKGKYYFVNELFERFGEGYDYVGTFKNKTATAQIDGKFFTIDENFKRIADSNVTFVDSLR